MDYEIVKKDLENILDGDISTETAELAERSIDWSLFKITPDMIVYPKHAKDIGKLVRYVHTHNQNSPHPLSITARAAGSGMSGGSLNHSIILDVTRYMTRMDDILRGDFGTQVHRAPFSFPVSGKVSAEPGLKYLTFEEHTLGAGMIMPTFPASRKLCALGGMVANNGAGEKSLKYGQNQHFVEELKVVLSDGNEYRLKALTYQQLTELFEENNFLAKVAREVYELIKDNWDLIQSKRPKTSKNSAGYLLWEVITADTIESFEQGNGVFDLTKCFVGAQGTTGIISEITYKLVPHETKEEMIVMFVQDIYQLPVIVETLKKHDVDTIELYDDHTFKIGIKFFGDFLKDKGFFGGIRYALRFMPEFWMAITGGIPKFVVLAESADRDAKVVEQEVLHELLDIRKIAHLKSFIVRGKAAQKYWDFRHDSFKLLTEHSKKSRAEGSGTRTAPFIDDIAIDPKHLPAYLPRLVNILDEYKEDFLYTIAGHLGDGNFHIIPLVDMNKVDNKERILEISERVYELVHEFEGSITAEHNDGIVRTPYLAQMFGEEMMAVFARMKHVFDPQNIFNPGKKIGMTKDDITKYLA